MSVLSTFSILFDTDAKKAADDTEKLAESLDDVEVAAKDAAGGVDGATQSYNKNTQSIGGLTKAMLGMVAAYVTFDAIASGVIDNATQIDSLGKFSQTLGLNIVELDAWGAAASRNGGSAEAFRGTVESLQTSLQDMEITGGGAIINTLAMIGIQATDSGGRVKSAFDILPEIAGAFEGMSSAKSFAFGKKLGLDQGTILMLQQGRGEVDKLISRQKALGGVTKEGYEQAGKFNDQWDDTKRVFNSLWMSANSTILPLLTKFFAGLENIVVWVRSNQDLVEGFFIGVAAAITAIYLPAITAAAAATIAAAAPFIAIGAAIAAVGVAVALLYEDIKAWVNGSESAIGEIVGSFEDFKDKVVGVFDSISQKWEAVLKGFMDAKNMITGWFDDDDDTDSDDADDEKKRSSPKSLPRLFDEDDDADSDDADDEKKRSSPKSLPRLFDEDDDEKKRSSPKSLPRLSASKRNTDYATGMISQYNSTNLNQGGYNMSQRTQNVNVNVGGANIDARGMSSQQASRAFNDGLKQNVEMAMGQLSDGVQR